jgi:hypothetical protein
MLGGLWCVLAVALSGVAQATEPVLADQSAFQWEAPPPVEESEIKTRGMDNVPARVCGTYQIRTLADKQWLHLHGMGDKLLSTRFQAADDSVRFVLELQRDGSVRIASKLTGQTLYEDQGDRLISARQPVTDARANLLLEPLANGAVRIRQAATNQVWSYNQADKLISTRHQKIDAASAFGLERVIGPAAVAGCTTDVVAAVLEKETDRSLFQRQAAMVNLRQAVDGYLRQPQVAINHPVRSLLLNLLQRVDTYLSRYPQGTRTPVARELADVMRQMDDVIKWVEKDAPPAIAAGMKGIGFEAVQAALEQLSQAQKGVKQRGKAHVENLLQELMAVKGPQAGRVIAVMKRGQGSLPPGAAAIPGTDMMSMAGPMINQVVEPGDHVFVLSPKLNGRIGVRTFVIGRGSPVKSRAVGDPAGGQSSMMPIDVTQTTTPVMGVMQSPSTGQVSTVTVVDLTQTNVATVVQPEQADTVIVAGPRYTPQQWFEDENAIAQSERYPDEISQTGDYDRAILSAECPQLFEKQNTVATQEFMSSIESCSMFYRGGGTLPVTCADNQKSIEQTKAGGICYKSCEAGYTMYLGVCWQNCPSGYRDDGAFCAKPGNYTRDRYPWQFGDTAFSLDEARERCRKAHPTVGCEKQGEIIYEKCKPGYVEILQDWCGKACPPGMAGDTGSSCTKKSYTMYSIPTVCAPGLEKQGALCYPTCPKGFHGQLQDCVRDY